MSPHSCHARCYDLRIAAPRNHAAPDPASPTVLEAAASYIVAADTLDTVRDVVIIAVLLLVFVLVFVFAILGLILFRQMRRLADRAETALTRVESGIEKFEKATDAVSGFAGSLASLVTKSGIAGLGRMFGRFFGNGGEVEEEKDEKGGEADAGDAPKPGP